MRKALSPRPILPANRTKAPGAWLLLSLCVACAADAHEAARRIVMEKWGWSRGEMQLQRHEYAAAPHCRFYYFHSTARLDSTHAYFAENASGELLGTALDDHHAGLARILRTCFDESASAQTWAEVVAAYLCGGYLRVLEKDDGLMRRAMPGLGLEFHDARFAQTAQGKTVEFFAVHGFSMAYHHVRATLRDDGTVQVQEDITHRP